MAHDFLALPLFLPGMAAWTLVALMASEPLGRRLGVSRRHGAALVLGLGIIFSATLTPDASALWNALPGSGSCDLSRVWLASLRTYLRFGETTGNVLMFVPLGAAVGLVPSSGRRTVLVLAALALPFAIEASQAVVTVLGRGCESRDVVDNLAGLCIGMAIGLGAGRLAGSPRRGEPHGGRD